MARVQSAGGGEELPLCYIPRTESWKNWMQEQAAEKSTLKGTAAPCPAGTKMTLAGHGSV